VEAFHRDVEAIAFFAESVFYGHSDIFEDDLAGGLGIPAHLVLIGAKGQAGSIGGHDQGGDPLRTRVSVSTHHNIKDCGTCTRDELVDAVEHILVAVSHRASR